MPENRGCAGTIGAEHVVGTIDSVLRTGRSFYRTMALISYRLFILYLLFRSGIPLHVKYLIEEFLMLLINRYAKYYGVQPRLIALIKESQSSGPIRELYRRFANIRKISLLSSCKEP